MSYWKDIHKSFKQTCYRSFTNCFGNLGTNIFLSKFLDGDFSGGQSTGTEFVNWCMSNITLRCDHINRTLELPFTIVEGTIDYVCFLMENKSVKLKVEGVYIVVSEKQETANSECEEEVVAESPEDCETNENIHVTPSCQSELAAKSFNPTGRIIESMIGSVNHITAEFSDIQICLQTSQPDSPDNYLRSSITISSGSYGFAGIIVEGDMQHWISLNDVKICSHHSSQDAFSDLPLVVEFVGRVGVHLKYIPSVMPETFLDIKCDSIVAYLQPKNSAIFKEQIGALLEFLPASPVSAASSKDELIDSQVYEDVPEDLPNNFPHTKLDLNCQISHFIAVVLFRNLSDEELQEDTPQKFFNQFHVPDSELGDLFPPSDYMCPQHHLMFSASAFKCSFKKVTNDLGPIFHSRGQLNNLRLSEHFSGKPESTILEVSQDEKKKEFEFNMEIISNCVDVEMTGFLVRVIIDISLQERISDLINKMGFSSSEDTSHVSHFHKIVISASLCSLVADVLFPVPDCSPVSAINFYDQKFRDDLLSFRASDIKVVACLADHLKPGSQLLSTSATNIDVLFLWHLTAEPCLIGRISSPHFSVKVPNDKQTNAQGVEEVPVVSPLIHRYGLGKVPKVPIDTKKMKAFVDHHVDSSLYKLCAVVESLEIVIPSKSVLEVLYNRLAADLLLWQPQHMRLSLHRSTEPLSTPDTKTLFSTHIELESMTLLLRAPFRQQNGELVENSYGDFCIRARAVFIGVVSGFKGDPNVTYIIFEVPSDLWALHCPRSEVKSYWPFSESSFDSFKKILSTVDLEPMDVAPNNDFQCDQALSLVVKTELEPVENTSSIETVGQCSRWVVQHFMEVPLSDYFSQLADVLCLEDFPIEGYVLPTVQNEFQFAVHHFQMDYVAINIPYAVRLLLGTFRIQVSADINHSTTIDVCSSAFYLTLALRRAILRARDFVPVAHLPPAMARFICRDDGLRDFSADLGSLEITFCADSFNAFLALVTHFVDYGDLPLGSRPVITKAAAIQKFPHPTLDVGQGPGVHTQEDMEELEETMEEASLDIWEPESLTDMTNFDLTEFELSDGDSLVDSDEEWEGRGYKLVAGAQPTIETCGSIRVSITNRKTISKAPGYLQEALPPHTEKFGEDYDYTQKPEKKKRAQPVDPLLKDNLKGVLLHLRFKLSPKVSIYGGKDFDQARQVDIRRETKLCQNTNPKFRMSANWMESGGTNRDPRSMVKVKVVNCEAAFTSFQNAQPLFWEFKQRIGRFTIEDHVRISTVKKILQITQKEKKAPYLDILQLHVEAGQSDLLNEEVSHTIRLHLLPLDMCLDQDTLIFLRDFYENLTPPEAPPPTTRVCYPSESVAAACDEEPKFYVKTFEFSPGMYIDVTYVAKRMEMRTGQNSFASLLLGLGSFQDARVTLKRVMVRNMTSLQKLVEELFSLWHKDIYSNQSSQVVVGLKPLSIFVRMFEGITGLVNLPVDQYNKDGRLVSGLWKGTNIFTFSYTMAILELLDRIFGCMQVLAETVNDLVAVNYRRSSTRKVAAKDFTSGFSEARRVVSEGMEQTYSGICELASTQNQTRGVAGTVGNILRHSPLVITEPALYVAEAAQTLIGAAKSHLSPEERMWAENRFKQ